MTTLCYKIIFEKPPNPNSIIVNSSLRILSFITTRITYLSLSQMSKIRQELIRFLISNSLQTNPILGKLISMVSLSYLLLCEDTSNYFLNLDGVEIILNEMALVLQQKIEITKNFCLYPRINQNIKKNINEIEIIYYGMLSLWNLSYHKKNHRFLKNNEQSFLDLMLNICMNFTKQKIIRVLIKILLNLLENSVSRKLIMEHGKLIVYVRLISKKWKHNYNFQKLAQNFIKKISEITKSNIL